MSAPAPCSRPTPCERPRPRPPPRPVGDLPWRCRVTQLLESLNRVVEEGNLFDPARPSLGSELEALRQHLEALRAGPDPWESHLDRPTGRPGAAQAVPLLGGSGPRPPCQLRSDPSWASPVLWPASGRPSGPSLWVPGAKELGRTPLSCPPRGQIWCGHLGSASIPGSFTPGPACPQHCPSACPVSSFSLGSVARDPRELWRFLMQNLSLPNSTAQALLAARVDLPEVRGRASAGSAGLLLGRLLAPLSSLPPPPLIGMESKERGSGALGPPGLSHTPLLSRSITCFLALPLPWMWGQDSPGVGSPGAAWVAIPYSGWR